MNRLQGFGVLLTLILVFTITSSIEETDDKNSNSIKDPDSGKLSAEEKGNVPQGSGTQEVENSVGMQNCTNGTDSCETDEHRPLGQVLSEMLHDNRGTLTRTFYVLIGVTIIVVIYFVLRAVR